MKRKRNVSVIAAVFITMFTFGIACICLSLIATNNTDKTGGGEAMKSVSAAYGESRDDNRNNQETSDPDEISNSVSKAPDDENKTGETLSDNIDPDTNTSSNINTDTNSEMSSKDNEQTSEDNQEQEKILPLEVTPFRFALSGDSCPMEKTDPQTEVFKEILRQIKEFSPDFYISTGDVTHGHTDNKEVMKQQLNDFLDAVSVLECNFFVSPGDNDLTSEKQTAYYKELVNKNRELNFYFEENGVYFIILASLRVSDEELARQFLWLEDLLKGLENQKVFIFIHRPVYSYMYPETDKENKELADLIHRYKVDAVFSGHEHLFHKEQIEDTTFIISGCSGSMPYVPKEEGGFYHYLIIDVGKDSWTYRVFKSDGELYQEETVKFN